MGTRKDFFVSYTGVDEGWATWVAWQLEQAGYTTTIQAWDFRPGSNFVLEMQKAASEAERTIMILSPSYLGSHFAAPEWAAAFASDPEGFKRRLVPVRIAECPADGLMSQLVYIDLVGLSPDAAASKLIAGISPARAKPLSPPPFPGAPATLAAPAALTARERAPLRWRVLDAVKPVLWSEDMDGRRGGYQAGTKLEVQLVAVEALRVETRRLRALPEELTTLGRRSGLFSATQQVETRATGEFAIARSMATRDVGAAGLMVGRAGQRGAWLSVPHDALGSILDVNEMQARLAAVLRTMMAVDVEVPAEYAVAASLGPTMMLMVGKEDLLGRRSSASMGHASGDVEVFAEDALPAAQISSNAEGVADELLSRLVSGLHDR